MCTRVHVYVCNHLPVTVRSRTVHNARDRDLRARDLAKEIRRRGKRYIFKYSPSVSSRVNRNRSRARIYAMTAPSYFSFIGDMYVRHACESRDTFPTFARGGLSSEAASSSDWALFEVAVAAGETETRESFQKDRRDA